MCCFDEIEKASDSLWNLLLGILDKATLTLGDNRRVDFSRALIFMTSNLGAREMTDVIAPKLGFRADSNPQSISSDGRLKTKIANAGVEAARRKFTPEFINRLDRISVFKPLGDAELRKILDIELRMVQQRILAAGGNSFLFTCSSAARGFPSFGRDGYEVWRQAPEAGHRTPSRAAIVQPDGDRSDLRRGFAPGGLRLASPDAWSS